MVAFTIFRFRKYHVPIYFMGIFGGFLFGLFISLAFQSVSGKSNFYLMSFICGTCMTLMTWKAYDMNHSKKRYLFKLWAMALMGSYMIMRGFSTVIGGYPSEIDIISEWQQESKGETS